MSRFDQPKWSTSTWALALLAFLVFAAIFAGMFGGAFGRG